MFRQQSEAWGPIIPILVQTTLHRGANRALYVPENQLIDH